MRTKKKTEIPRIFKPFFEEPEIGGGYSTMTGKNRGYAEELKANGPVVKKEITVGLSMLKDGLPEDVNGNFARHLILSTAVHILGAEGAPIFAEMLCWPWILEDRQLHSVLLSGVEMGGRENLPALQEYGRQYALLWGKGPDTHDTFRLLGKAAAACMLRGFTDVSMEYQGRFSAEEGGQSAGYVR